MKTPLKCYRNAGKIAGVCKGLSVYFDWNVTAVRLICLLLLALEPITSLILYYGVSIIFDDATVEEDPIV